MIEELIAIGIPQWFIKLAAYAVLFSPILYMAHSINNLGRNERQKLFELEAKRKAILDML